MASYVQHPRSTVTGAMPPGTLPIGVIAVNFPDRRLTTIDTGSVVVNLGRRIEPHNAALAYKQHDIVIDATGALRNCLADIPAKVFTPSDWGSLLSTSSSIVPNPPAATNQRITSAAIADIPLSLRGFAGQTGDLQQWQNSAGTVLASISAAGALTVASVNGVVTTDFARKSQANLFSVTGQQVFVTGGDAKLSIGTATSGNPLLGLDTIGQQNWVIGVDRADAGSFGIASSTTLTTPRLKIAVAGTITLSGGGFTVVTNTSGLQIANVQPALYFNETDAAADEKLWRWVQAAGDLAFGTRTDADGAGATAITIARTGVAIDSLGFSAGVNTLQVTPIALTLLGTNTDSVFSLSSGGAGTAGDSVLRWNNSGNVAWTAGIDRSAGTNLLFVTGATIDGATPALLIGTNGAATFSNLLTVLSAQALIDARSTGANSGGLRVWTNNDHKGGFLAPNTGWAGAAVGDVLAYAVNGSFVFSGNNGANLGFKVGPAGQLTTGNTRADEVGFKGAPVTFVSANYTLQLAEAGWMVKAITNPGIGITIPSNAAVAFPDGTLIGIHNRTGGNITIAPAAGILIWNNGLDTRGTRTLANNSVAVLYRSQADEWVISGAGLS